MPILCFEGASAIGKTILSKYLRDNFNAFVIPEVNLLFQRTPDEPRFWYFERQVERWQRAASASENHEIIILDGDPFQPIWYNWSYDFDFGEPFEEITEFYRGEIAAGKIAFPDRYFILTVKRDELRKRKTGDASRTRKNFDRHLRFIEPQKAYFSFIKSINNGLAEFIENKETEKSAEKVINSTGENFARLNKAESLALFDSIKNWLNKNKAENFIFSP